MFDKQRWIQLLVVRVSQKVSQRDRHFTQSLMDKIGVLQAYRASPSACLFSKLLIISTIYFPHLNSDSFQLLAKNYHHHHHHHCHCQTVVQNVPSTNLRYLTSVFKCFYVFFLCGIDIFLYCLLQYALLSFKLQFQCYLVNEDFHDLHGAIPGRLI